MNRTGLTTTIPRFSGGFTLLELMLALALSTLVLAAMGVAMDVHLRLVNYNRTGVEEAQLARALLDRIAEDLRGAVLYRALDADQLVVSLPVDEGLEEEEDTADEELEELLAEEEALAAELEEADLTGATGPQSYPGLFGNQYELQIDMSRLPRMDELDAMLYGDEFEIATQPSDVKTVSYFVVGDQVGETGLSSDYGDVTGMVRREFDRAAAFFAAESGGASALQRAVVPIAPEVTRVEFFYFDGYEWLDYWDSVEFEGLPVAVEITIGIVPAHLRFQGQGYEERRLSQMAVVSDEELQLFRRVVYLPVARPPSDEEESEEESVDTEEEGY